MSNRTKSRSATAELLFIPLNRLKKSPKNVRKIPHTKAEIHALAASIAAIGMLQCPVVEPEIGQQAKPTGFYLVNAGEGRRLAQLQRAKRKEIKADEPIPCLLDTEHNATEISLAENAIRCDMHPADQYEAFAKLHDQYGMSAEDIAARFGVTVAVVRQRLKLGAVSPKLMALYRKGEMNLDQLSAFAITDDHERQELAWAELPPFHRSRDAILRTLTEGQVRSDDRRAIFVGTDAYETAGGSIIRDLFNRDGGGFFADAELLNRLTQDRLEAEAAHVKAEGWHWVVVAPEFDHEAAARMRRVFAKPVPLTAKQRRQLRKLRVRYDALYATVCDKYPDGDVPEAEAAKLDRIEAAIQKLEKHEYVAKDLALAGAFVCLAHDGALRIERGYIRPEDEPKAKHAKANGKDEKEQAKGPAPLSDKLVSELTAYRTSALRNELAGHPATAVSALLYTLVLDAFFPGNGVSCLEIGTKRAWLSGPAPGIDGSKAEREIAERHAAWGERLPDAEGLWDFIRGLSDEDHMSLLAHCVSLTLNAVHVPRQTDSGRMALAERLASEVGLDMNTYWQPSVSNYLSRVSKERIVEALREAGISDIETIARLKKPAMAAAAEAALAGKNWLPSVLRTP